MSKQNLKVDVEKRIIYLELEDMVIPITFCAVEKLYDRIPTQYRELPELPLQT